MPGLRCPRLFLFLCCRSRHVIRRRDIDPALFKKSPAPSPSPRSGSGSGLGIGNGSGKGKGKRKSGRVNRTPVELVRDTRELLVALDLSLPCPKWEDQLTELSKNIREMTLILYGSTESEPVAEACAQLTREFFQDDTIRLFFVCLPKLDLEARKDVTRVVANLQRQLVQSRIIACEYLEQHTDLIDFLVLGYENMDYALHYGRMLRECIRHQSIARYLLESEKLKKFFSYVELPNFDIASDATATFMELLTRHKLTVSEFLTRKYDWFFTEYNGRLLESPNYITRRFAVKLLGDILLDRSNATVTMRYVSSKENLQILMNLLREPSKNIQITAFHIFKVFVINKNKPPEIVSILLLNRPKLLRFFSNFTTEKEDEQFDLDKAHVVKEIAGLESKEKI